ncbi:MAG: bifunctional phosphopantothenoylcysteine decarboxylase/phosphopantothenate synthase [Methanobrevibacter sp.]|jgi:phosphopantothenoylcysteine decarboxylase/phosphopantothenate--cysteine ligase|nr:bifunctional phosphopantothenoylcysteine decarboxylase/phosphopantothenate synthase [Candidatus Methanoflexus mossambicus]
MRIVLCVTGSIAATETIKLARAFRRLGVDVKAFISEDACKIIHPNALEFATGNSVVKNLTGGIEHVKLSQEDLILVAPATANVISKFAYKIADNPINTLLITAYGHNTPILFVPSMHDSMYTSIEENIEKLKKEGINFLNPKKEEGKAKFPDSENIILESLRIANMSNNKDKLNNDNKNNDNKNNDNKNNDNKNNKNNDINNKADFKDKNVLITLGGTYESIDPIRGIVNKSSGKMGLEIAKNAYIRGANITIIAANHSVKIPSIFNVIKAETTEEMNNVTEKLVKAFDIFIATAAISDFSPINSKEHKISSSINLSLEFKKTEKIIKKIKKIAPNIILIGFKAEYDVSEDEIIECAKKQMINAGTDLVVANDLSINGSGFGSDKSEVIFVNNSIEKVSLTNKSKIAELVLNKVHKLL